MYETFEVDDVIANEEVEIQNFMHTAAVTTVHYAKRALTQSTSA